MEAIAKLQLVVEHLRVLSGSFFSTVSEKICANLQQDMVIIATSSCTRFLPSRRGYSRVSPGIARHDNDRRGRHDSEDENRLIDQLDEEWDD